MGETPYSKNRDSCRRLSDVPLPSWKRCPCRRISFFRFGGKTISCRCHHSTGIILRQTLYIGTLRHAEHKGSQKGTTDNIHFEPVASFKFRQSGNDLLIPQFCFYRYRFCRVCVKTKLRNRNTNHPCLHTLSPKVLQAPKIKVHGI